MNQFLHSQKNNNRSPPPTDHEFQVQALMREFLHNFIYVHAWFFLPVLDVTHNKLKKYFNKCHKSLNLTFLILGFFICLVTLSPGHHLVWWSWIENIELSNCQKITAMIPNCCFGNKFLWELYIDFLLLIEMVTCCVFKVEFTMYKEDNQNQESDEDQPWIIFGEYLPMGYVVLCFFNLWFSYRIFRVLSKRKLILTFGLIYRTLSLLGKYFSKNLFLMQEKVGFQCLYLF